MKKWYSYLTLPIMALLASCSRTAERPASSPVGTSSVSFYSLHASTLEGEEVAFEKYKGKKILVVNTASECGYTPQYEKLEQLYQRYADRLIILGFPSNDFGGQEPGDANQIRTFCTKNYGVSFPLFEKVKTSGSGISPVYAWLTDPARNGWNKEAPTWNFCKYLLDEQGQLLAFYPSSVEPDAPEILKHF